MPIVFERRLSQDYCKTICEARRHAAPNHKYNFKDYELTDRDCSALRSMAIKDACGFYYNALVSFLQGCHSVMAGCVSWACVELYYSLYYATRANLYYKDYLLIRDGGLYLVKIARGEHPETRNNKKYNTDHGGTLNHFLDKFQTSDYLCTNTVDTENVYRWMMDLREVTNYRHKCFCEPESFAELAELFARINAEGIVKILHEFKNDFDTYCFSVNHAWLCVPYYKLLEVAAFYKNSNESLTTEQEQYVINALSSLGMEEADIKELLYEVEDEDDEEFVELTRYVY